jgi:hypothetical protein
MRNVMKVTNKYVFLLVFGLLSLRGSAQLMEEDTTTNEPFFKAHKFNSKCYIAAGGSLSQILKSGDAMYLGFSLNWVINHKFVVTAQYTGITSPINIQKIVSPDVPGYITLSHQFVGGGFSYIIFDNKRFSLQPELCAGWGNLKYVYNNDAYRKDFVEIVPAVYAVYNATKFFRFGVGLNYRITAGASVNGLNDADMSGIGGLVFIRVGTF